MIRTARIKDHYAEQQLFMQRALGAGAMILIAICILIARLIYLQIVRYDYFLDQSLGNRIRNEPIPPNRGLILDRNGIALGLNAPSYQLELTRDQVPDLEGTLQRLAALSLLDRSDVPRFKKDILGRRGFETVPLKLQLNDEDLARFSVRRQDFPGVEVQPRMTRYYPLGASGVHALGYVSAISIDDQKSIDMDEYAGTTLIGKSGVEKTYEPDLHGKTGYQELLVNAQGRHVERVGVKIADLKRREPVAGNDLYLTIDQHVQQAAEELLRGKRGAAVAIDPKNGDVIALVSTPGFDPNFFSRGISRTDYVKLKDDPDIPLYNRALQGTYPSGSTIKPFLALAGLRYGVIAPDTAWYCKGRFNLPNVNRVHRDWKPQGHGYVNMYSSIQHSCDTYFYQLSDLIGIDRIHDFLAEFGFGKTTQLDVGGDRPGLLPSTEWKRRVYKQPWYRDETVSVGIGQGYLSVTPIQLASATATLAARGQKFKPRLVHAIRDSVTGQVRELPPQSLPPVPISEAAMWDVIFQGMQMVMKPGGTGAASGAGASYSIAGKTGTAQVFTVAQNEKYSEKGLNERLLDHGLFVAFAPVESPKIALVVVLENGKHGTAAAVIARRMLDVYLLSPEELKAQDAKRKPLAVAPAATTSGDDE
jgi:penicillin-binding protein 2